MCGVDAVADVIDVRGRDEQRGADAEERALRRELQALQADADPHALQVAQAAHELGRMLASPPHVTERLAEAERLYAHALVIMRTQLAPSDPAIAVALHDWAVLCEVAGELERADVLWGAAEAAASTTPPDTA